MLPQDFSGEHGERPSKPILIGFTLAGLIGMVLVPNSRVTRLKEDTALGLVLLGFFGVGI